MRRKLALLTLTGFLAYTGVYLYVYMTRAFRVERPRPLEYVGLYHGDNFSRVLLVGILFLIGEVFLLYVVLAARRPHRVDVRADLWAWLQARETLTGEPADTIAERAIAQYRTRLEGGPGARLPSVADGPD
ncbi:MAG TPA: hypothetical protein VM618_06235 [Acidimicrobiia bacterium]|nr:hypothetical protein [Acidimicrobiia bacterium]